MLSKVFKSDTDHADDHMRTAERYTPKMRRTKEYFIMDRKLFWTMDIWGTCKKYVCTANSPVSTVFNRFSSSRHQKKEKKGPGSISLHHLPAVPRSILKWAHNPKMLAQCA